MRSSIRAISPGKGKLVALLGVLLLLAEGSVAALSLFHPRVDPFYASYYITGSRTCWLTPDAAVATAAGLRVRHLAVAALSAPQACFLLEGGWSNIERWGVWSAQSTARIEVPTMPGAHTLTLSVLGFSPHNRQTVKIWLNGRLVGDVFVPVSVVSRIAIPISPGLTGTLVVTLRIKHPSSPTGADQRKIGVGLIALDWS